MQKKIKKRTEVSDEFKWKISDLCESDEKWETLYETSMEETKKILEFKGKLLDSENFGETLLACLKAKDTAGKLTETAYVYANLRSNEDSTNSKYQAMSGKADNLIVAYSSACSFIEPEILSVPEEIVKKSIEEIDGLKIYKHYVEDILRTKEHILPAEQEEILALSKKKYSQQSVFGLSKSSLGFQPTSLPYRFLTCTFIIV